MLQDKTKPDQWLETEGLTELPPEAEAMVCCWLVARTLHTALHAHCTHLLHARPHAPENTRESCFLCAACAAANWV